MAAQRAYLNKKTLNKITDRIIRSFPIKKIILFGSHAYGRPRKDSDIDLFIIMESNKRPSERRIAISRLFKDREMPMDFIVKTPAEIRARLAVGDHFVKAVLAKGSVLYEK
ncbi:MAG: nucleotidyltransferase domain-containing protein [Candidatus Aminicenantales bacterium]|jgi:predicted nucleotidyltransferase